MGSSFLQMASVLKHNCGVPLFDSFCKGKRVDYASMGKSMEFTQFVQDSKKLTQVGCAICHPWQCLVRLTLKFWTILSGKPSFWTCTMLLVTQFLRGCCLTNVAVIHGYLRHGVPETTSQRTRFYQSVSYKIGDYVFSLDGEALCPLRQPNPNHLSFFCVTADIEHGVLRG